MLLSDYIILATLANKRRVPGLHILLGQKLASEFKNPIYSNTCLLAKWTSFHLTSVVIFSTFIKIQFMNYGAINIDAETMGGTPVFTGTRVPIQSLFDYIETGETLDEFLDNFPSVKKDFAIQVLEMASKTLTSEKILNENFA